MGGPVEGGFWPAVAREPATISSPLPPLILEQYHKPDVLLNT